MTPPELLIHIHRIGQGQIPLSIVSNVHRSMQLAPCHVSCGFPNLAAIETVLETVAHTKGKAVFENGLFARIHNQVTNLYMLVVSLESGLMARGASQLHTASGGSH